MIDGDNLKKYIEKAKQPAKHIFQAERKREHGKQIR